MHGALYGAESKETDQGEADFTTDMLTTGTSRYINRGLPLNQHAYKSELPCHNGICTKEILEAWPGPAKNENGGKGPRGAPSRSEMIR